MKHRFNNLPSQLSGGEQQRVSIARAIAMKPELILADEPTGNLDTENSSLISDILFNYVKEEGSSLIIVTHDLKLANKAKRKIIGIKIAPLNNELKRERLGPSKALFYSVKETWFVTKTSLNYIFSIGT